MRQVYMFDIQGVNRVFCTNMQPRLCIFLDLENIIGVRLVYCEYIQSYNSNECQVIRNLKIIYHLFLLNCFLAAYFLLIGSISQLIMLTLCLS